MTIANREKSSVKSIFTKYGKSLVIKDPMHESTKLIDFPTITSLRQTESLG